MGVMKRFPLLLAIGGGVVVRLAQSLGDAVIGPHGPVRHAVLMVAGGDPRADWLYSASITFVLAMVTGALYPLFAANRRLSRGYAGGSGAIAAGLATVLVTLVPFARAAAHAPAAFARTLQSLVRWQILPALWIPLLLTLAGGALGATLWRVLQDRSAASSAQRPQARRHVKRGPWIAIGASALAVLAVVGVALANSSHPLDRTAIPRLDKEWAPTQVVSLCVAALSDPDVARRREAAVALAYAARFYASVEPTPDLSAVRAQVERFREGFRDSRGAKRENVLAALRKALPALHQALSDADEQVRWHALWTTQSMGPEASALAPDIAAVLSQPVSAGMAEMAAAALAAVAGASAAEPLRALVATRHGEPAVLRAALCAASSAGPGGVDILVRELSAEERLPRLWAAKALAQVRPEDAGVALPALEQIATTEGDPRLRAAATTALGHLLPRDSAIALMLRLARQPDATQAVCSAAVMWLNFNAWETPLDPAMCTGPIPFEMDLKHLREQCLHAAFPNATIEDDGSFATLRRPDGTVERVRVQLTSRRGERPSTQTGWADPGEFVAASFETPKAPHSTPNVIGLLKVAEDRSLLEERHVVLSVPGGVSAVDSVAIEPPIAELLRWPWVKVTYHTRPWLTVPEQREAVLDTQTGTLMSDAAPARDDIRRSRQAFARFVSPVTPWSMTVDRRSPLQRARIWWRQMFGAVPTDSDAAGRIRHSLDQLRDGDDCETPFRDLAWVPFSDDSAAEVVRFVSERRLLDVRSDRGLSMCVFGAIDVAARLGPRAAPLAPALQTLVDQESDLLQLSAAMALLRVTGDQEHLFPVVAAQASGPHASDQAVNALTSFPATKTLPVLVETAEQGPVDARRAAIAVLLSIHARAEAAPAVRKLLSSTRYDYRLAGIAGLAALDPDESLAALGKLSGDESPSVRSAAMEALRRQGSAALPVLVDVAAQRSHPQRLAALEAIRRLGATTAPAIRVLEAAATDPDPAVSRIARYALDQVRGR